MLMWKHICTALKKNLKAVSSGLCLQSQRLKGRAGVGGSQELKTTLSCALVLCLGDVRQSQQSINQSIKISVLESTGEMIQGTKHLTLRPRFGMIQLCDLGGSNYQFPCL